MPEVSTNEWSIYWGSLRMDERNELKQLRKEVKNLRMEKEIFKKYLIIFR